MASYDLQVSAVTDLHTINSFESLSSIPRPQHLATAVGL